MSESSLTPYFQLSGMDTFLLMVSFVKILPIGTKFKGFGWHIFHGTFPILSHARTTSQLDSQLWALTTDGEVKDTETIPSRLKRDLSNMH